MRGTVVGSLQVNKTYASDEYGNIGRTKVVDGNTYKFVLASGALADDTPIVIDENGTATVAPAGDRIDGITKVAIADTYYGFVLVNGYMNFTTVQALTSVAVGNFLDSDGTDFAINASYTNVVATDVGTNELNSIRIIGPA